MTTTLTPAAAHPGEMTRSLPPLGAGTRWWIGWAVAALTIAELPILLSYCCGPAGLTGVGTFWFVNDFAQYEAAMRQGAASASWLVYDQFTPEPHQPALMLTPYVALGKLASIGGMDPLALYRPAELLARIGLLLGVRPFVARFLRGVSDQPLASVFIIFAGGLGLPMALLGAALHAEVYTGNGSYEVNGFGLLFSAPHAALAMGLTLAFVAGVASPPGRIRPAALVGAALSGVALALLHPFHLPALLAGLGLFALLRLRRPTRDIGALAQVAALALGAAPLLVYDFLTFARDPFWSATYGAQNLLPSPLPWQLPIDYGVLLALAMAGVAVAIRRRGIYWALLSWLALLLFASYLPVPYQRRLGFGLQPVLAVLAVIGLAWATDRVSAVAASALRLGALALALITTAAVAGGIIVSSLRQDPLRPYRADVGSANAARVLAARTCRDDLVLANWDLSNYLAGQMPARVAAGHPVATLDAVARKEVFSAAGRDPARWQSLIARFRPSYVLYGPREVDLPPPTPGAHLIASSETAKLYAIDEGRCG